MPEHYNYTPGEKILWNSSRAGWVVVTVVRRSRKSEYAHYWVVVDADGHQERIAGYRTLPLEEGRLMLALKGVTYEQ